MDRRETRQPNWGRIGLIAACVAALIGLVVGVRALSAPVERAGEPTIAVPAPTGTRFTASATPTTTATQTGTPSGTATATGTATEQPTTTPTSTMKSSGRYTWSTSTADAAGSEGTLYRYAIAVETTAKVKPDTAAGAVAEVLNDPRSWTGDGDVRFALVPKSKADITLYLASTGTAAQLCGSDADAAYSCATQDAVVLNAERWKAGASTYASLADYRTYLVNHAVGQLLGEKQRDCGGAGKKAPVMMQQSVDLDGCTANPWP
ncbi:DUF3152 domain-containing protein [Micropruina sonneratiae]|uniref:DUF3152 domain-containing protein n=1 Tax=Micropruina sonneratiae TaxID=2986940 RepID=UPI0022278664|nr:DUF3152 domain-containing protein [Micropruina sp. KQZ13P-5]MCW3159194.1 DUF3152 domain-containing protein [Micropruina sp. KQZ13P-5]